MDAMNRITRAPSLMNGGRVLCLFQKWCGLSNLSYKKGKAMRRILVAFMIAILALFPSAAQAQDAEMAPAEETEEVTPEKAKKKPRADKLNYIGPTVGGIVPFDLKSVDKTTETRTLSEIDLDNAYVFGLTFGHIIGVTRNILAIELEWLFITGTDAQNDYFYTDRTAGNVQVNIDADITSRVLMLNVVARKPSGKTHPYGGLGAGWAWFEMENTRLIRPHGSTWASTGTNIDDKGDLGG